MIFVSTTGGGFQQPSLPIAFDSAEVRFKHHKLGETKDRDPNSLRNVSYSFCSREHLKVDALLHLLPYLNLSLKAFTHDIEPVIRGSDNMTDGGGR